MRSGGGCAAAVLVVAAAAVGCRDGAPTAAPIDGKAVLAELVAGQREAVREQIVPYRVFEDALPNVRWSGFDGSTSAMSDVLVVGRITAVEPGLGFRDKYQEEPLPPDAQVVGDGVVVDFDDPAAQWRTMTLTVEVTEVFGGALDERQIRVGFGAPSLPFEKTRTAFLALGRVALPLFAHSAVYAYDDSLWAVTEDGNLLAVVADDGSLALPFALEHSDVALLANVRTIAELRTAALRARVVKPDPSLRELQP